MTDAASGQTQIVAIVDDDEAIRPALARLIKTLDYDPRTFASADALLGVFDALGPSCVMTDIQMPGMNGYMLVHELHRRRPSLPIILMTAYPSLGDRELVQRGPFLDYMTKPLDDAALEAWLSRMIGLPRQV